MGLLAPLFEPRLIETDPDPEHSWLTALRQQEQELWKAVRNHGGQRRNHLSETSSYILGDAIEWLADLPANSVHGVVTDPPYGIVEYEKKDHQKLRLGRGGVWRIPPAFDGAKRQPLPRFTVLTQGEITALYSFFSAVAHNLLRVLVPGGHVLKHRTHSCPR